MHFVLQTPSLQHLAAVKIVTCLWNKRDIIVQIAGASRVSGGQSNGWNGFVDEVKKTVSALPLPQRFTKQLCYLVSPIGWELLNWCGAHLVDQSLFTENLLPPQLCWTMHGTVDYAKTAELMLKNEGLNDEQRYILSCINCIEDEARDLFQSLGEKRRQELIKSVEGLRRMDHRDLITFFTCTLSGRMDQLRQYLSRERDMRVDESIHQYLFMRSIFSGSRAICQYFFEKLNRGEKEQVLSASTKKILSTYGYLPICNLMYYLSLINEERRNISTVVETCAAVLLPCLLRWPMQSLFTATAKRGWPFMDESGCNKVLSRILIKLRHGHRDYDYSRLFWRCWRLTPADYKQHLLGEFCFLQGLCGTKEVEFLKFVLNEAPSRLIQEIFYNRHTGKVSEVLLDETVISEAALMECKQTAALMSSNDKEDAEKRLRSEGVSRLVDLAIKIRIERRE